jgi:hypothetical protein
MKKTILALSALIVAVLAFAVPGPVYALEEIKAHVGGGISIPTGQAGKSLDTGWRIDGGATFYPSKKPIGFRVDLAWDWWDVSNSFLDKVDTSPNVPGTQSPDDGDARSIRTTFNVLWEPAHKGTIGFYLTAGAGVYYLYADLGNYDYYNTIYCDWWYCYPVTVTGEYTIKDESKWEWGANAGAAITFELQSGSQFYIEADYEWVDTQHSATWIPVSFGWRW